MLRNKRGAIELSITTIIIIVIGVALLVLGLTFVSKIFKQGSILIDTSLTKADASRRTRKTSPNQGATARRPIGTCPKSPLNVPESLIVLCFTKQSPTAKIS